MAVSHRPLESKEEQSLSQAINQTDYTLKKYLDLSKVASMLYEDKTIPKRARRFIKVAKQTDNIQVLMQTLDNLAVFPQFLLALEAIGDKNHLTVLSVLAAELKFVQFTLTQSSHEEAIKTINEIQQRYYQESVHQDLPVEKQESGGTSSSNQPIISPLTDLQSALPIYRELPEVSSDKHQLRFETHTFTKTASSTFYSSAHGVSVSVPEEAFPPNVSTFELTMTASLESPLPFDLQCYSPCSCVVSLTCQPPIEEFGDYVTVEVPHCVLNVSDCEDHLCVLSAPDAEREDVEFQEDPHIEVDFIDSRYVLFKTKHFSRYMVAVSKKVTKQRRFSIRMKSSAKVDKSGLSKAKSLESSSPKMSIKDYRRSQSHPLPASVHPTAVVEYCVAMLTPRIKAEDTSWTVIFIVTLCVPTAFDEQYALRLLGVSDVESLSQSESKQFVFSESSIKFSPTSFDRQGWNGRAMPRPPTIQRASVEGLYTLSEGKRPTLLPPNCQKYMVERVADNPRELMAEITVKGADCCGETVVFTLVCPSLSPRLSAGEVAIPSIMELYSTDSPIRQALSGTTSPHSVPLSLDDRDTISLLAELSFHLHNWRNIASLLNIKRTDIDIIAANFDRRAEHFFEAAFQMLRKWIQQTYGPPLLGCLLETFAKARIFVLPRSWRQKMSEVTHWREECDLDMLLRTRLPRQIASQWRFIARFLGIEEFEITSIVARHQQEVVEQAVEMLGLFKSRVLPISLLRDAIHAVYEHTSCLELGHSPRDSLWFIH